MRRVFLLYTFARWASKVRIPRADLCEAVEEMERGLIDADLGGGLFKKRLGVGSRGKRGGGRVVLATNLANRWIFLMGFLKNEQENLNREVLRTLRDLAQDLLRVSEAALEEYVALGELEEICHGTSDD